MMWFTYIPKGSWQFIFKVILIEVVLFGIGGLVAKIGLSIENDTLIMVGLVPVLIASWGLAGSLVAVFNKLTGTDY